MGEVEREEEEEEEEEEEKAEESEDDAAQEDCVELDFTQPNESGIVNYSQLNATESIEDLSGNMPSRIAQLSQKVRYFFFCELMDMAN